MMIRLAHGGGIGSNGVDAGSTMTIRRAHGTGPALGATLVFDIRAGAGPLFETVPLLTIVSGVQDAAQEEDAPGTHIPYQEHEGMVRVEDGRS